MVKVFKNFKETNSLRLGFSAEGIYGGALLAVRSNEFICFYDWNTLQVLPPERVAVMSSPCPPNSDGRLVALSQCRSWTSCCLRMPMPGFAILFICKYLDSFTSGHCSWQVVRRIEVAVRDVRWSDSGSLVAVMSENTFYLLQYNREAVEEAAASGREVDDEDGIEDAFEILHEVSEHVRTGVGGCC